ncbi:TetR/AcrR family transcriptional regulator [Enterococcus sp. AZ109]|uniref:TetR/AcrR family transcriptional regulator n=1 Tax=Enterococcus sp. AZ109 TaxID=2774634 RepID=UPI003F261D24
METSETKQWIVEALIRLLKRKNYSDITITNITDEALLGRRTFYRHFKSKDEVVELISLQLVDGFADRLLVEKAETFDEIMKTYFTFWEENIELFLLLNKARLLYYIEENIETMIVKVALKVGHVAGDTADAMKIVENHKYEFAYKLAGFWKLTLVWSEEMPRKSASEMSQLIVEFMGVIR